jgi:hypothetical protein
MRCPVAYLNWYPCSGKVEFEVEFDPNSIDVINVPQHVADPYRVISISKIPPGESKPSPKH